MSGSESGSVTDQEILEFRCKKCPGKTFTAAEKDAHRMFHKQRKGGRTKIGPKSKTSRASRGRSPSPATSGITLFEPVDVGEPSNPSKKPKRRSNKSFDETVMGKWVNGNGS